MAKQQSKRDAVARERRRHIRPQPSPPQREPTTAATSRRQAAMTCGWCGSPIEIKPTGRIPKWCSASCRQRAWEQSRAAASGLSAIEVVERVVEVAVAPNRTPRREEWAPLLRELITQLDNGRIYDRDLPGLRAALTELTAAFNRRLSRRPRH